MVFATACSYSGTKLQALLKKEEGGILATPQTDLKTPKETTKRR